MAARYILRFDDLCPTMNWSVWDQVETVLNKYDIKPIIAIVPDNQDPELKIDPAREDFWEKVRGWQASNWSIALHGYQHIYTTQCSGLTKINNYSEFAGYSYDEQLSKLENGLKLLHEQAILPTLWVAPGHSFDKLTIKALLKLGINTVSDGYYFRPIKRCGALWIPQQLWRFRWMHWGLWTVCFHTNEFVTQKDVDNFVKNIEEFAPAIISLEQAIKTYPAKEYNVFDVVVEYFWRYLLRAKTAYSNYL